MCKGVMYKQIILSCSYTFNGKNKYKLNKAKEVKGKFIGPFPQKFNRAITLSVVIIYQLSTLLYPLVVLKKLQ